MADLAEKNLLIDLHGLSVFLDGIREETDEKIAQAGIGVTYTITKDDDDKIVLLCSDGTSTSVTDTNTTYGFSQSGSTLTITPSDGDPITVSLGEDITKQKIIDALGFEPISSSDIPDVPTTLAELTDDETHRLVTDEEKTYWNAKANVSAIPTKPSDIGAMPASTDLSVYSLATEVGYDLGLSIDGATYVMTLELKNINGTAIATKTLDLPIESMVIGATYADGKLTLTLQSGSTLDVDISAIVSGLVNDTFTIAGIDMKDDITVAELKTALGVTTYEPATPSTDGLMSSTDKVRFDLMTVEVFSSTEPTGLNVNDQWMQEYE